MSDIFERENYDEFYVAYFDARGNMIYPSDIDEVRIIKKMLSSYHSSEGYIYPENRKLCYKIRVKRKMIDGNKVQVVELSNVTEFMRQVSKASVDEVTHLNTRKLARNMFMEYIEEAYEKGEEFSVILADLDGFKNVNDTYGHVNGDLVLSEVSRMIFCSTRQENYREQDIVARLGGDEFVIIMKNIPFDTSTERAEKIRKKVEEHKILLFAENDERNHISVGTLSIGLYHVSSEELTQLYKKGYTTDEIRALILDRTDSALYSSKNNGKNKVTTYSKEKIHELVKKD